MRVGSGGGSYKITSNNVGWNSSRFPDKQLVCRTLEIMGDSPLKRLELGEIRRFHQCPTQAQTPLVSEFQSNIEFSLFIMVHLSNVQLLHLIMYDGFL